MILGEWRGIIHLERVLHGVVAAIVVLVLHSLQECLPTISGLQVGIIYVRVVVIRFCAYLIRQRKQAILDGKSALIVDTSIDIGIAAL